MTETDAPDYRLYTYWRSSAAYRVRIAMHLKGIPFESVYINLAKDVQSEASYTDVNPSGLVPTLECLKTGQRLTQSVAILEYLDALHLASP